MTIDEAIEKYKEITNTVFDCPRYCMRPCDECVQECGQVVEWLEKLKELNGKAECARCVYNCGCIDEIAYKDGYNKAIDDFSEKLKENISESLIWGMIVDCFKYKNMNDTSDKIVDYVIDTVKEIAEQLKVGGEN